MRQSTGLFSPVAALGLGASMLAPLASARGFGRSVYLSRYRRRSVSVPRFFKAVRNPHCRAWK